MKIVSQDGWINYQRWVLEEDVPAEMLKKYKKAQRVRRNLRPWNVVDDDTPPLVYGGASPIPSHELVDDLVICRPVWKYCLNSSNDSKKYLAAWKLSKDAITEYWQTQN